MNSDNGGAAALEAELATTRAEAWAARCESRDLRTALEAAQAKISELALLASGAEAPMALGDDETADTSEGANDEAILFDAIDDNGDGVLTREEFTKGYSLFLADVASQSFDAIDEDGSGTIDREEFKKGFALLTSDSARAAVEREKIEVAVAQARKEATKEAALVLAQAELMDVLNGAGVFKGGHGSGRGGTRRGQGGQGGRGGRDGQGGQGREAASGATPPPLRKWGAESDAAYSLYGPLPPGFDAVGVEALLSERCAAKARKDFRQADLLQEQLVEMGGRIDDRWRTWAHAETLAAARAAKEAKEGPAATKASAASPGGGGRGRGRGGGRGRRGGSKRLSPGEQRWREGAKPNLRPAAAEKEEAAVAAA